MPQRNRTAFADILRNEPEPLLEDRISAAAERVAFATSAPAKRNKAISPDYTKLTAYIPRRLAAAIKMSMALDQTGDQSEYIEHALTDWLSSKGRQTVLFEKNTGGALVE